MFAVGLDVDTFVFTELPFNKFSRLAHASRVKLSTTPACPQPPFGPGCLALKGLEYFYLEWEKILLYAGNFSINSPLVFITFGKSYLKNKLSPEQSAGNFSLSTTAMASTRVCGTNKKIRNTYILYKNMRK